MFYLDPSHKKWLATNGNYTRDYAYDFFEETQAAGRDAPVMRRLGASLNKRLSITHVAPHARCSSEANLCMPTDQKLSEGSLQVFWIEGVGVR